MQWQKLSSCQSCYGSTRVHFGSRDPCISGPCWNSDHDDKPMVQSWTILVSGSQVVPPGACQQGWGPCCPGDIRVWGFNVMSVNAGGRLSQVRWAKSACATHAWRGRAGPGTRFLIILKWWHCGNYDDDYNGDGINNDDISWIWRWCWPCEAVGASLSAS